MTLPNNNGVESSHQLDLTQLHYASIKATLKNSDKRYLQ